MTAGGWFKCDRAAWDKMAERMTGAWPRECVEMDLVRWSTGAVVGEERPSRRALAARWGWTRTRAADAVNRHDKSPVTIRSVSGHHPVTQRSGDADGVGIVDANPVTIRSPSGQSAVSVRSPPSGDADGAHIVEAPESRELREREDTEQHMAAARHAADKRQAEQDEQWQALCSRWDTFKKRKPGTTARRLSRSKGQGAELWKMRKKPADFELVLEYITAGATSHALNFRDQYDTQPITVRRHVDQWADLAREWRDGLTSGPSVADEASRAWDTVLRLLPRSPKLPDRISNNDDRETATRAALKAVGVQQLRRANHFDQRAMKAQFLDAYTRARR